MSGAAGGERRPSTAAPVWHACPHCTSTPTFQTTADFVRHLQTKHCTRLDAAASTTASSTSSATRQYICRFGPNAICQVAAKRPNGRYSSAIADNLDYDLDLADDYDDDHSTDTFEQHVLRHHLSPLVKRKESTGSNRTTGSSIASAQHIAAGGADTNSLTDSMADWTIYSSAQNLPAVLNDPSRGKQSTLFTRKWGVEFVERTSIAASPLLPEVTYADLDAYMQRIGKRYRRHQRLQQVCSADGSQAGQPEEPTPFAVGEQISDIPTIFMQQQLQLTDPLIFAQVFVGLERQTAAATDAASSGAAAADASARLLHLQERLSHYLDVVEVHITRKVSQQSASFFAAMTSQHAIVAEMHAAQLNVRRLRRQIAHADGTLVRDALRICATRRRQQNHVAVVRKLKIMAEVHKTQPMIQLLLGTGDYVAAIDLIRSTQDLLARELPDVQCVKHLPSQLAEMERLIDKMLRTEFERMATAALNRREVEEVEKGAEEVSGNSSAAAELPPIEDAEKLAGIVWGLLRQRTFAFIETLRDEAIVTVRAAIKEMLIEVLATSDSEICLTGAGEESQQLSIGEWIELLDRATDRLLRLLRRVRAVVGVAQRVAAQSAGQPADGEDVGYYRSEAFLEDADLRLVRNRLAELMCTVCTYCHERCATLISSQSLERTVATAAQIERLQRIVRTFSAGSEALTRGLGPAAATVEGDDSGEQAAPEQTVCLPLLAALQAQATRFAQKFHADRKQKLALLLDSERWRATEVPAEIQRLVSAIADGRWATAALDNGVVVSRKEEPLNSPALLVDGEPFVLVGSALILLQVIDEYARCATQLPVVAAQLARNVVDLLRTFNSRSCQLILGAGALRVAGLKTITSANLALVARALQLVVWLLPHVRAHFQRAASGGSSGPETVIVNGGNHGSSTGGSGGGYEIVERDLLSHIAEIDSMVLQIVTQLVASQMDAWTARPPVPSQSFRNICRHLAKLHEAVAPIMPAAQVRRIYEVVHRTFKDKLREQLVRCGVVNNGGPAHGCVIAELTFYAETVRGLGVFDGDGAEQLGDEAMADVWRK